MKSSFQIIDNNEDDENSEEVYSEKLNSLKSSLVMNFTQEEDDSNKFPRSFYYLLGNEASERFSYYGIKSILIIYLTNFIGYSKDTSTSILHTFNFVAYLFPLLGAYLADTKFGKFKTILYFSIIYVIGGVFLSFTSIEGVVGKEGDRSSWGVFIGLALIAIGTGGIKPVVPALAGEQLKSNQTHLLDRLFQLYYFSINFGSILSTLLIPITRKYVGYWLAFGIPALFLSIATATFVFGSKHYVKRPVSTSILWTFSKIIGFAIREKYRIIKSKFIKRHIESRVIYTNPYESIEGCNWVDLSKTKFDSQLVDSIKAALNVLLVFTPLPIFWSMFDQTASTWTHQAQEMDLCITRSFCIEPEQMQALNPLFVMIFIPIIEFTIYQPLKKFNIDFKPLIKMSVGMWLAVCSYIIAMVLQISINSSAESSVSVLWLLPQYCVLTIGEIFISITGLEFAYANSPASMKSLILSGWLMSVSMGNLFVVFVVSGIKLSSQSMEFLLFASVMSVFTILFMFISYRFKPTDISISQYNENNTNSDNDISLISNSGGGGYLGNSGGLNQSTQILLKDQSDFNSTIYDDDDYSDNTYNDDNMIGEDYKSAIELNSNLI